MRRDHVDHMLQAWADRDPGLITDPLAVAGRILRLARFLDIAIARSLAPLGLSFEDFDVLNTLRREGGGPVRPSALARAALISSGAMTARLSRLHDRGLITRAVDDDDRRAVQVSLTADGEKLAIRALAAVIEADESVLAPLDRAARTATADLLRTLLVPLERADPGGSRIDQLIFCLCGPAHRVRRAVDEHGQVIDVLVSARRDAVAARRSLRRAMATLKARPTELVTDATPPCTWPDRMSKTGEHG